MSENSLTPLARNLRRDQTEAEKLLWSRLRSRQLEDAKFVRQFPIGPYIADFACRSLMLVIELDGGQHADNPKDIERTRLIESFGYRALRFWNNEVLSNPEGVLEMIAQEIRLARNQKPSP
jgi:very-short-patch-repair endonuclease